MLTIRFAEFLRSKNISFFLITSEDTRISNILAWAEQANLSELGTGDFQPTHLFLPHVSGFKTNIPWGNIATSKLLVWAVHPTEVFTTFFPGSDRILNALGFSFSRLSAMLHPDRKGALNELFELMLKRNSLIAMDAATSRGIHFFYPDIKNEIPLLPIPCPVSKSSGTQNNPAKSDLSVGYFGRVDRFKYSALRHFVSKDLRLIARKQSVDLHLVAEGPFLGKLLKDCIRAGVSAHNHGFLENNKARMLIKGSTHLGVAMGTAALDIAATEHPCLILDPTHQVGTSRQEKFRFVSEIEGYTLGECRDFPYYQPGAHTLDEALLMIRTSRALGSDCARYVRDNHDPEIIFENLVNRLDASTLLASDVVSYVKRLRS